MTDAESKKLNVDDIFAEIEQIDTDDIKIHPDTLQYFETIAAYLKCFDELEAVYNEMDPSHRLSGYDMPDIKRHPIQQLSLSGEPVQNLAELYEVAEAMFPVFKAKIEDLLVEGSATNGTCIPSSDALFKLPPGENKLKAKQRTSEKARDNYSKKKPGPPESWLFDIVRGSILFQNADQILDFLERIRADDSIEIIKSKNRFRNPTLSGYRDWNLQLQISTNDGTIKHICELQLHLSAFKEADARLGSHSHYEFFRKYYSGSKVSLEARLNDLRMICEGGSLNAAFLGEVIRNPLEMSRMLRISDLFEDHVNDYQLAIIITYVVRESLEPADFHTRLGTLFRRQFKLKEAMALYEKALDIELKALGPDHVDVADTFHNMANVLDDDQGQLEEAMGFYHKALDIRLKALGPDHVTTANTYNNMAIVLKHQGKLEEAMSLYQKGLDIYLKALGHDHANTANTYNNMAIVLDVRGKLEEAMELYQKGKLEEAMALYQKVLDIRLNVLGPGHPDMAVTHQSVAHVLSKQGKLEEAMDLQQKALGIYLNALGPGHVDVAGAYNDMGDVLHAQGKLEEAMALQQKALDILLKTLGPNHICTSYIYRSMAVVLTKQGKLEEAMALKHKALDIILKTLGPDHANTASIYNSMANALNAQGKLEEAITLSQKALDIYLQARGPGHVDVADTYYNMASILHDQGKLEAATQCSQKAHAIFLNNHGPEHSRTAESRELLDKIHLKLIEQ